MTGTTALSLEGFILETTRVPQAELTLPRLEAMFRRLELPARLLEEHTHFSVESYCRSLVCRTPRFDMLILGWRKGQISTIHDHLDSLSVTQVLRGTLRQRIYRAVGRGPEGIEVAMLREDRLGAGARASLDAGGIHQMGNVDDEDLVTLHIYSAPLAEITVFEPEHKRSTRKRLRYSLEDEFV